MTNIKDFIALFWGRIWLRRMLSSLAIIQIVFKIILKITEVFQQIRPGEDGEICAEKNLEKQFLKFNSKEYYQNHPYHS